jgi:hypothetical protein
MQNPGSDAGVFVWGIRREFPPLVIPGRAKREPGIHNPKSRLVEHRSNSCGYGFRAQAAIAPE